MVKKWLEPRKRKTEFEYDETKREFEMAMGKPFITVKVKIPTGFENLRSQFLSLEKDEQFHEEVEDLVKKRLILEKRRRKSKI
jgi:hypothetical protein